MKPVRMIVALSLIFVIASWAPAKKIKVKGVEGVQGSVKSIDKDSNSFVMRAGKKKNSADLTVKFDKMTKFLKMTDAGTDKCELTDLAAGKMVAVVFDTKDTDFATQVTIIEVTAENK